MTLKKYLVYLVLVFAHFGKVNTAVLKTAHN